MPIMEIKILPVGTRTVSVSRYVAESLKILRQKKKIKFKITPMGTVIEGNSISELLDIAAKMHKAILDYGANRVVTFIELDERSDKKLSMKGKLESVKRKLNGGRIKAKELA